MQSVGDHIFYFVHNKMSAKVFCIPIKKKKKMKVGQTFCVKQWAAKIAKH